MWYLLRLSDSEERRDEGEATVDALSRFVRHSGAPRASIFRAAGEVQYIRRRCKREKEERRTREEKRERERRGRRDRRETGRSFRPSSSVSPCDRSRHEGHLHTHRPRPPSPSSHRTPRDSSQPGGREQRGRRGGKRTGCACVCGRFLSMLRKEGGRRGACKGKGEGESTRGRKGREERDAWGEREV